ncbi:MAG: hypothetical protein Q7S42_01995, partial [Candidatus Omnitrophota bacterium]|nr:hypothetical protein [Candidatus Omnitrophota bacterium]
YNQTSNFCEAKTWMDRVYDKSRSNGLSYAFSNSRTSSRIGDALGDDFNYWLGTGGFYNAAVNGENNSYNAATNSATFRWQSGVYLDTTTNTYKPKYCGITVTADLPKITTYELKHAKWNYPKKKTLYEVAIPIPELGITGDPIKSEETFSDGTTPNPNYPDDPFNIIASLQLMKDMIKISDYLKIGLYNKSIGIYNKSVEMVNCCNAGQDCDSSRPPNCWDRCPQAERDRLLREANQLRNDMIELQNYVIAWFTDINTTVGGNVTIPTLQKWDKDIFDNVWGQKEVTLPLILCDNVINYTDESEYSGAMVINIDKVTLEKPDWTTKCTVYIFCDDDYGISRGTTSSSTAKFYGDDGGKGENIGKFIDNYYPEIKAKE